MKVIQGGMKLVTPECVIQWLPDQWQLVTTLHVHERIWHLKLGWLSGGENSSGSMVANIRCGYKRNSITQQAMTVQPVLTSLSNGHHK